jgi:PIN domain nuclease of toxin-antitoxin system
MSATTPAYLLDTNVLIWLSSEVSRVPGAVLDILETPESVLYVSTVSFWELAIKQGLGKIDGAIRFDGMAERHGIRELTIHSGYIEALRELPMLHGDDGGDGSGDGGPEAGGVFGGSVTGVRPVVSAVSIPLIANAGSLRERSTSPR